MSTCPNCDRKELFQATKNISSGGGHAPNLLPGLGGFWKSAQLQVVACAACGLTRLFATPEARERLSTSEKWQRVS